jgi:hypothetical protein
MSNTVFIAGTPYINKPFLAEMRHKPTILFSRTRDYLMAFAGGKESVGEYQKRRFNEYTADAQNRSLDMRYEDGGGSNLSLVPPPTRQEDFEVQGYRQTANGIYQKSDPENNTHYIWISAEIEFEKKTIDLNGEQVEAWVSL